jgi:hypothetical protein
VCGSYATSAPSVFAFYRIVTVLCTCLDEVEEPWHVRTRPSLKADAERLCSA